MDLYIYAFIGFALSTILTLGVILNNKLRDRQPIRPYMLGLWLVFWAFWPIGIGFSLFIIAIAGGKWISSLLDELSKDILDG